MHTLALLLVVLAAADVPPPSAASSGGAPPTSGETPLTPVDEGAAPPGEARAPAAASVASDADGADRAPLASSSDDGARVAVAFLGVMRDDDAARAGRIEEELRALLLADRAIAYTPEGTPELAGACFDDVACRTTAAASLQGAFVVAARVRDVPPADAAGASRVALDLVLFARDGGRVEHELSFVEDNLDAVIARLPAAYAVLLSPIAARAGAPSSSRALADTATDTGASATEDGAEPATTETEGEAEDGAEGDLLGFDTPETSPRRLEAKPPPPAPPPVPLDEGLALGTFLYMGAFAVGGALVALSGAIFDLASPTSTNGTLDVFDAVGPALVVTGVVIAAVGVVTGLVFEPFQESREEGAR